jgi:hypothetical protein
VSVFQRFVTNSKVVLAAHQAVTIKTKACCVRERNFSILASIILAAALIYQKMWEFKGVP